MSEIRYEFPLRMPPNWRMTPSNQRQHSTSFPPTLSIDDALRMLEDELNSLGIRDVGVFTNTQGLNNPRLRKSEGQNSGVTLQFGRSGQVAWMACDKWQYLEHNIYALHLAVRAIRNLEQWGIIPAPQLLQSLFPETRPHAQAASPTTSTETSVPAWMHALGLGTSAQLEDAIAVYRRRAKAVSHDEHALLELNQAMEQARIHFGASPNAD